MSSYVYLIHFERPYKHAKHYLGSTNDLNVRLANHRKGQGARLIQVLLEHGINYRLSRLWKFDTEREARLFERTLKRQKNSPRFCPWCNPGIIHSNRTVHHTDKGKVINRKEIEDHGSNL